MTVHTSIDSPLGELLLVGEESSRALGGGVALTHLSLPGQRRAAKVRPGEPGTPEPFAAVIRQLEEYFAGARTGFEVARAARGTAFQQRVWAALDDIPYGTTTSYGVIADRIGVARTGVRAVAAAIGANPLLIVCPCHRVIGAGGALTGYAAGLDRKRGLLVLEGALPAAPAGWAEPAMFA